MSGADAAVESLREDPMTDDGASVAESSDRRKMLAASIAELEKECDGLNAMERYEEATTLNKRLTELKREHDLIVLAERRSLQVDSILQLEQDHIDKLQEFNGRWDKKIKDYEDNAADTEAAVNERQWADYAAYFEKLQKETEPRVPKWSKELLNLRKIQQTLGKMKDYEEAGKIKAQADKLEEKEHKAWEQRRNAKIAALEETFLLKQKVEMDGLLEKIAVGREKQGLARKSELERMQKHYMRTRSAALSQQAIDTFKAEKNSLAAVRPKSPATSPYRARPPAGSAPRAKGSTPLASPMPSPRPSARPAVRASGSAEGTIMGA